MVNKTYFFFLISCFIFVKPYRMGKKREEYEKESELNKMFLL